MNPRIASPRPRQGPLDAAGLHPRPARGRAGRRAGPRSRRVRSTRWSRPSPTGRRSTATCPAPTPTRGRAAAPRTTCSTSSPTAGSTVLVPQSQVYDLRVALSGKGLPAGDADSGYSLLDKQGMTATDFQQNVAYRRALEGELNKTLEAIDGVQTAVVHLAMPKKDVFTTEQDKATGVGAAGPDARHHPGPRPGPGGHAPGGRQRRGPGPGATSRSPTPTGRLLSAPGDGLDGAAAAAGERRRRRRPSSRTG